MCVYVCVPVYLNMYHMYRSKDNVRSATENTDHHKLTAVGARNQYQVSCKKKSSKPLSHLSSVDVGILKIWTDSLSSTKRSVPIFQMLASKLKLQQFPFTIWWRNMSFSFKLVFS